MKIQDLRIGLIGVSHWHVPLYIRGIKQETLLVVGVSDPSESIVEQTAGELGCSGYRNYHELLDQQKPDFVFAFAPHNEMPDVAMELIRRGIPFAMEKPMGLHTEDVVHIRKQAEKKQVFCAVPFVWRYSPLIQDFKKTVDGKDIIHLAFKFIAGPPSRYLATSPWMLSSGTAGGGSMTNLGVHFIDMAMFLTGCTKALSVVSAFHRMQAYDIDTYATTLVTLESGATLLLETGYTFPMDEVHRDNRWNIVTKNGYYTLGDGAFEKRVYGRQTVKGEINTDSDVYYPLFVKKTLGQYINGEQPLAGLKEMEAVHRVLDAVNLSGNQNMHCM